MTIKISYIKRWFYVLRRIKDLWERVATLQEQINCLQEQINCLQEQINPLLPRGRLTSVKYLDLKNVIVASEYIKQKFVGEGIPVQNAEVIHHGIKLEEFSKAAPVKGRRGFKMLFAGQVAEHKGVHTIIEALALIGADTLQEHEISLTAIGGRGDIKYKKRLDDLIEEKGLGKYIVFTGHLDRKEVKKLYPDYDTFILSSVWDEPFSISLLEAMASGIPIIGTATGGSREILKDGENCLVYSPGDARQLAEKIMIFAHDADLRNKLAAQGYATVKKDFTFKRSIDSFEKYLIENVDKINLQKENVWQKQ